jgi:hypothetical protein
MILLNVNQKDEENKMGAIKGKIYRPALIAVPNILTRLNDDYREHWPYKIIQIGQANVYSTRRDIFLSKNMDMIGFSFANDSHIFVYDKKSSDGRVEITVNSLKYVIFPKQLEKDTTSETKRILDQGMSRFIHTTYLDLEQIQAQTSVELKAGKLSFSLEVGKEYQTANNGRVKLIAFEDKSDFATEPMFIGLIKRNDGEPTNVAYRCDINGKTLSHGGNSHYDIVEPKRRYRVYTYAWLGLESKKVYTSSVIDSDVIPRFLEDNPRVKYEVSIGTFEL